MTNDTLGTNCTFLFFLFSSFLKDSSGQLGRSAKNSSRKQSAVLSAAPN